MATRERFYNHPCKCWKCKGHFESAIYNAKFCSGKCRTAYHREKKKHSALLEEMNRKAFELKQLAPRFPILDADDLATINRIKGWLEYLEVCHEAARTREEMIKNGQNSYL